ncbi:ferritin-like domain-containing protein [Paenibacillus woosongensis]|uniref:Ferritin-like domain-containing protein n=1 Tax=Paenibacillus woosongensis TaxID=307580 RepID=A0A7X2YYT8_9BACL|nr:ferritin-like domain-containing protein [Paenibacillus woosongensis]MUG43958.1 ferritin-like domain-containing protein [Paenibacillus woosongensis]
MYYTNYYRKDTGLVADIERAINGEYSAISCYEQLAGMAPHEEERNRILEIRQDEIGHFQTFSQIYTSLTGMQPVPHITEECPSEYAAGLHFAFKDEQETVDFYLDVADKAADPYIKERFKRASADEQNHAVWFLYFITSRHSPR